MHKVVFENCENSWKNALPMGNGCFGAMAFYEKSALSVAMNHYEIYYNLSENVLPDDILNAQQLSDENTPDLPLFPKDPESYLPKDGEPFSYYRIPVGEEGGYSDTGFSSSYPATGEIKFSFANEVTNGNSRLELYLEKAAIRLDLDGKVSAKIITSRKDMIVTEFHQEKNGLIRSLDVVYPDQRDRESHDFSIYAVNDDTFVYTVSWLLSGKKPFTFSGIIRLVNARGKLNGRRVEITEADNDFVVLTGVFTKWNYDEPSVEGVKIMDEWEKGLPEIKAEHHRYWQDFFSRAKISVPDKFLERVYYVNQYALDCCSGKDGVMKHHACGLNGLWDIRHPNLWGSMWYWDVNIQAAFAGVFSSNRLDLGKVFSDGLRCYLKLAENWAKTNYGLDGAAMDYPYPLYFSCWPWCAQYLWSQYEYSLDKEYLKNEAYPLFLELCRFAVGIFKFDEKRNEYVIFPDISPEQGSLATNSVATVSSVKYLLKFTLESAEILDDHDELLPQIRHLCEHLPQYPTVTDDYGIRFLDSEQAPANLWIRHPMTLMTVFPTNEIDLNSEPKWVEAAKNTITFLETHCEIGVFQVSWLAAASARLGNGQKAIRLLYEMGLDQMLRSNGLSAEETERFMNYCAIERQPLYYPCMMEFTGEMLAAVNEMLLQSHNGVIRLFPALPDGSVDYDRLIRAGQAIHEYNDRFNRYDAWKHARFERLLARGAVEVSASVDDGKITWMKIESKKGGRVNITSPYDCTVLREGLKAAGIGFTEENGILSFDTVLGQIVEVGIDSQTEDEQPDVMSHLAFTKRHIYIGENADTAYHKAVDGFIRDWYLGNARMENHTVYKFDLGGNYQKDYQKELYRQFFGAEPMIIHSLDFVRLKELPFTVFRGYGFENAENIRIVRRGGPDGLREDFVEGDMPATFLIEVPKGQYEMLAVSGDEKEDTVTVLETEQGLRTGGGLVKAGQFQCKVLPVIHEEDGCIRLKIYTIPGKKWKLNFVFVNLVKQC